MIKLHYWPTPNGQKPLIMLEETGLDYEIVTVNIGRGEQFEPDFLRISPNNRIPALVDDAPADGGAPQAVFESGAILLYLAGKVGRFIPAEPRAAVATHEWLMWQMGGFGPMLGQAHHFRIYAPEEVPYGIKRYTDEATRLYKVLDKRLTGRDHLAGAEYTIADMAAYPWSQSFENQGQDMADYPAVAAWRERVGERAAVRRAYAISAELRARQQALADDEEAKRHLFGQTDTKSPAS